MRVDLSRIPRDKTYVVHIPTVEAGKAFLDAMREQYPKAVSAWTKPFFEEYRIRSGGNFYCPRLNLERSFMTHGDRDVYANQGFGFLEFDDVLYVDAEMDTELSDLPIESLFT